MSKSKYRYKNGQAVRVREDLEFDKQYFMKSGSDPDKAYAVLSRFGRNRQYDFRGQIVHISHKANGRYKIVEDSKIYWYTDTMLEPLKPYVCRSLL